MIFPFPFVTPEVLEHLRSRLATGAFRPLLDPTTFALDDIVEAYRYVETGHARSATSSSPSTERTDAQVRVRRMTRRGIRLATASVVPTTSNPAFSNIERVPTNAIVVSIRFPFGSTGCASTAGAPFDAA